MNSHWKYKIDYRELLIEFNLFLLSVFLVNQFIQTNNYFLIFVALIIALSSYLIRNLFFNKNFKDEKLDFDNQALIVLLENVDFFVKRTDKINPRIVEVVFESYAISFLENLDDFIIKFKKITDIKSDFYKKLLELDHLRLSYFENFKELGGELTKNRIEEESLGVGDKNTFSNQIVFGRKKKKFLQNSKKIKHFLKNILN